MIARPRGPGVRRQRAVVALLALLALDAFGCAGASGPDADSGSASSAAIRTERTAEGETTTRARRKAERALADADLAAARGRVDEALGKYREAREALPDDPRVLAGLVRVLIERGELDEAIELDDRLRALAPPPPRVLAPLERCALWLAATRQRLAASDAAGETPERGEKAAVVSIVHPDPSELLDRAEADPACPRAPASQLRADVWALEAERAAAAGDAAAGIAALRAAVAADPARADLEAALARALLANDDRREAVRALSDALARHPDSEDLRMLMLVALGLPGASAPTGR